MPDPLDVLSLQPYYGGSHKQFNDNWQAASKHWWTTIGLPPRNWKWRMRHAAIYFAEEIRGRIVSGEKWDVILCTDMLNVAELKGILPREMTNVPVVLYFHENQFAYPNRVERERDFHFSFTNFVSALAADTIWFNSQFNFDSLVTGLQAQSRHWPDFVPQSAMDSLASKMRIEPPGITAPANLISNGHKIRQEDLQNNQPLHLVWAARWEHDKNPDGLLAILNELRARKFDFRVSVLGESFRRIPDAFKEIRNVFSDAIVNWGFQESRESYWAVLASADVFLSTADHEFFGIAAAEAIAAGVIPVLPNRLAYPELLQTAEATETDSLLYDGSPSDAANLIVSIQQKRLAGELGHFETLSESVRLRLQWKQRAANLDCELEKVVRSAVGQ